MIEERFEYLNARFECHTMILSEHDTRLEEFDERLAKQDSILEKSNEILQTFKNAHSEHFGWTQETHGITDSNYFSWHWEDAAADRLKVENWEEFLALRRTRNRGQLRGLTTVPRAEIPWPGTTSRRPIRILIPEGDKECRQQKVDDQEEEVDLEDPRGKRPMDQKKKKKSMPTVGTLRRPLGLGSRYL